MKVSREQAAENRERILSVAARLFRERGIDGVSLNDIMKAAGLTHGGFYGHFKSKEDLVAQASALAISNRRQAWMRTVEEANGNPFKALSSAYLTKQHRAHFGQGCPFAALGGELARQTPSVRHAASEELGHFIDSLSRVAPGRTGSARRKQAISAYASMIGALIMSRVVDDADFSDEILESVSQTFAAAGEASSSAN